MFLKLRLFLYGATPEQQLLESIPIGGLLEYRGIRYRKGNSVIINLEDDSEIPLDTVFNDVNDDEIRLVKDNISDLGLLMNGKGT